MPCDSISLNRVDIGKVDPGLLALAMAALGVAAGAWSYNGDRVTIRNRNDITQDQIKQAYSGQVVKATAKKYGWQVKETAPNKYQIVKR